MGKLIPRADPLRVRLQTRVTAEQDARRLLQEAGYKVRDVPLGGAQTDAICWVDIGGSARTSYISVLASGQVLVSDPFAGFVVPD